jgi:large subunit ribosomal protein L13
MAKRTVSLSREEALAARRWYLVDAQGKVLGRLASEVAKLLRGKSNPAFSPHVDCGDFVVVINAAGVGLTGKKLHNKIYYRHTGYPGGIKQTTAAQLLASHPERVLRKAVVGMLPKNRLGRQLAAKLKIYPGPNHPHTAQQPSPITLTA